MPKFIKTDRISVTDDAGNTVYVRRKMDLGTRLRVTEAFQKGEGLIALYVHNIMGWEGPDFKGISCTPENIEKIDIDDPFWEQVGSKLAELNPNLKGDTIDPLASTTDGAPVMTDTTVPSDSTT